VVAGHFVYDFDEAFSKARHLAMRTGRRQTIKRARSSGDVIGKEVAYLFESGGELMKGN
jgi:hypothetical protein